MKRIVLLLAMLSIASVVPCNASIISVGDVVLGNSWSQGFNESGVGNFDLVAVKMLSAGDSFETATHSGFSDGSWALLYEDTTPAPIIASASGTSTNNLTWNIKFTGTSSDPLNFVFVAFNGETIAESANADWNGSAWNITLGTWAPTRSELVPEPATMALLGLGVLALRRKKA